MLGTGVSSFAIEEPVPNQGNFEVLFENTVDIGEPGAQLYESPVLLEEPEVKEIKRTPVIEEPSEREYLKLYDIISKTAKDVYNLQIEDTRTVKSLLQEPLTWEPDGGAFEKLHLWGSLQTNMLADFPQGDDVDTTYRVNNINVLLDGKLKGGKEYFGLMLDVSPQSNYSFMKRVIQDAYIQTRRVANHAILFGNTRPGVGMEGEQSPYTLPLWSRSQIAKHFSAVRKVGLKVKGNYSLAEYDFGGYSSDTYFSEFMPGGEFDAWVNIKPFGKTDGKYGKMIAGGGVSAGERHDVEYMVSGAHLAYQYKKIWLRTEYANADGSNGATGLTDKKREGWNATLGYYLNKKLEVIARYDEFDADKKVAHSNIREYTAGMNYYIKGQAMKLVLNYIYCQTQNKLDSHKLLLGTQLLL